MRKGLDSSWSKTSDQQAMFFQNLRRCSPERLRDDRFYCPDFHKPEMSRNLVIIEDLFEHEKPQRRYDVCRDKKCFCCSTNLPLPKEADHRHHFVEDKYFKRDYASHWESNEPFHHFSPRAKQEFVTNRKLCEPFYHSPSKPFLHFRDSFLPPPSFPPPFRIFQHSDRFFPSYNKQPMGCFCPHRWAHCDRPVPMPRGDPSHSFESSGSIVFPNSRIGRPFS